MGMRWRCVWREILTVDVGVERVVPLLLAQLRDAVHDVLVRVVVEEDVDAAHLLERLIDDLLADLLLLEVGLEEVHFAAVLLHVLLCVLRVLGFFGEISEKGFGAFHGEEDCRGSAYAAIAARDDGFSALELASGLVDLEAAIFRGDVLGYWFLGEVLLKPWSVLKADGRLMACDNS